MFPLNSNTPYVKDTGERARLGQIVGGSDTPELPDYGIADAGKVLTVGEDGSLEWDTKGSGGGDAFLSYDFTKVGTRENVRGVNFSSDGANLATNLANIPLAVIMKDITLYLDVGTLNIASSANNRFIMGSNSNGFIYKGGSSLWGFYAQNGWDMSEISDPTIFNDSTVKVYIDSDSKWHISVGGDVIFEPTRYISDYSLMIGSEGDGITGIIKAVRVYNGNYTE